MAQVNAGRVRFVGRGEYSNSTQYYTFDYVNYNGNSYFAKSNTLGNLPTNTTYWQLVAEKGNVGSTGPTGNGIASITKTSTSGLVDTYTITFTNGNTTTFNVTNGNGIDHISLTSQSGATKVYTIYFTDGNTTTFTVQDGEVTQEVFDEEIERANMIYNAMPKVSGEGMDLTLNNTAECPVYDIELSPSELEQETTTGKNYLNPTDYTSGGADATFSNDIIRVYSTRTNTSPLVRYTYDVQENDVVRLNGIIQSTQGRFVLQTSTDGTNYTTVSNYTRNYVDGTTISSIEYTVQSGVINVRFLLYSDKAIPSTDSESNYKNVIVTINNSNMTYEPYTGGQPSPNPSYPQQIHTVSGDNSVKVGNKNIWNGELESGTIGANGVPTALSSSSRSKDFTNVQGNTTYTISHNGSGNIALRFYDENEVFLSTGTTGASPNTFTTPNNCKKFKFVLPSHTDLTVNVQIEKSSTATTYEPHKEQNVPINLPVENLFDKDNTTYKNNYYKNDSGVETYSTISGYTTSYVAVKPNTNYTIQGTLNDGSTSTSFGIYCYDNSKNWISRISQLYSTPHTFTTPNNCYYIQFQYIVANYDANTIQLEKGTKANSYTPYGTTPIEYCKIGDYEDEFYKATESDTGLTAGKWYLKKNVEKKVFDGTENWTMWNVGNVNTQRFYLDLPNNGVSSATTKSDKFYYLSTNDDVEHYRISQSQNMFFNEIVIFINKSRLSEVTSIALKRWMSDNNITFYRVVTTPTFTLLSDTLQTQLDNIHKAITYQGQTNVSQTNNDLPFVIKLSAIRDLSGIFELIQG